MAKERPRRSAEFTFQVALKELREQKTLSQLASEHEVHPTQFTHWKKQLLTAAAACLANSAASQSGSCADITYVPMRLGLDIGDLVRYGNEHSAKYGILLNIHDAYRPTGLSRSYPNLLTQEGIRGNEHMPIAHHNATLPFTRFVAGAGDYTICCYTERKQATRAHQLGMAVITYSPMHTLLWHDRSADAQGEVALAFFAPMPSTGARLPGSTSTPTASKLARTPMLSRARRRCYNRSARGDDAERRPGDPHHAGIMS
jgi:hypothetical protein